VEILARFGEPMPARDGVLMVSLEGGASDVAPIVRALDDAGLYVESLELVKPTLDDVFVAKTGRHLEGAGDAPPQEADQEADRPAGAPIA
jgi:ABC-2 type transport system ATP-binding protein